jgi:spermidine synthase
LSGGADVGVRRRRASLMLMVASGFAGLGYQIVWTQQCVLWLGHESAAVLAVVAAFFGGLAVGAFTIGSRIARSKRPVRWYAGCEFTIALWSLFLIFAMPPLSAWALRMTGVQPTPAWQWSVAFLGTFLLFLPATAAMGATLPAMERMTAPVYGEGQFIAALYASNTLGAVVGVLAAAFWLVPMIGLARTAGVSTGLNLLCGVTSLVLFPSSAQTAAPTLVPARPGARGLLTCLALTGLLGIGYEVLVVRVLSQVTEDTVYTFAMMLAVYLVGTAAGAAGYKRWIVAWTEHGFAARSPSRVGLGTLSGFPSLKNDRRDRDMLVDLLLGALAAACLVGTASLWTADHVKTLALHALGGSMGAALAAEAVLALVAFGPATVVMGALFSHLSGRARASGVSFGCALGVNTLGAATAPVVWGVLAVRSLGPKLALLLICLGYLALTARRAWSKPVIWVPAGAALALALFAPPLTFIDVPDGGHVVSYQEGVMAAVSVVEDANGVVRLRINNRQQEGSSATFRVDARQAWLPLLLHPAPERALFLGLGTGVTAGSAAEDPKLHVDAVELLPEVIAASAYFSRGSPDRVPKPSRDGLGRAAPVLPQANARLHVMAVDARRYVRASDRRYDVIISDNFHPARSGSGSLYTVEHFQAVRRRLDAGGLFCQWLPLHQLDLESLRSIVQSFLAAYPHGWAMLASNSLETPVFGLVGRGDASRLDVAVIHYRLARLASLERVAGLGLEDELAVLGSFVAGPDALRRFAGGATPNTDDRPVVAYAAPRVTYAPDSRPRDRLLALLRELSLHPKLPQQLILPTPDPTLPDRLAAYWVARDRFIESGRDVRPLPRVEDMLAQVREPLLSVLRICPDFRPAYDPLLSMATDLARTDVSGARALLSELRRIQPARDDAGRALDLLGTAASTVGQPAR